MDRWNETGRRRVTHYFKLIGLQNIEASCFVRQSRYVPKHAIIQFIASIFIARKHERLFSRRFCPRRRFFYDSFYRNFIRRFLNACTSRRSKELRDLSSVVYYKYKKRVKHRGWLTKCHDKSRNHHYIASFIKDTRILKTRHFYAE